MGALGQHALSQGCLRMESCALKVSACDLAGQHGAGGLRVGLGSAGQAYGGVQSSAVFTKKVHLITARELGGAGGINRPGQGFGHHAVGGKQLLRGLKTNAQLWAEGGAALLKTSLCPGNPGLGYFEAGVAGQRVFNQGVELCIAQGNPPVRRWRGLGCGLGGQSHRWPIPQGGRGTALWQVGTGTQTQHRAAQEG